MRPMVKRIPRGKLQRGGVFNKFFAPVGVACNVPFVYARRSHKPPFVMVAAKPHFADIIKRLILINLFRG